MAIQVRRVVTGHDKNGRAVVKIDEVSKKHSLEPARTERLRGLDHGVVSRKQHGRGR